MKMVSPTQEKTGLQYVAMVLIGLGSTFMVTTESLENKIIGLILLAIPVSIMLYKYKREVDRGIPQ